MSLPENVEERIAVGMQDREILGFVDGGIKMNSGRISPYYINMRNVMSISDRLDRLGRMSSEEQTAFRCLLVA